MGFRVTVLSVGVLDSKILVAEKESREQLLLLLLLLVVVVVCVVGSAWRRERIESCSGHGALLLLPPLVTLVLLVDYSYLQKCIRAPVTS